MRGRSNHFTNGERRTLQVVQDGAALPKVLEQSLGWSVNEPEP